MIRSANPRQLEIVEFVHPFGGQLDPENRWVRLARKLPWEALAEIYHRNFTPDQGAPAKPARWVVGAVILKHKLKLTDREVIAHIQENPYLQYFVGLRSFRKEQLFDPSLFVTIRKRLDLEAFMAIHQELLRQARVIEPGDAAAPAPTEEAPQTGEGDEASEEEDGENKLPPRKGKLILDAVVTEQQIKYPTDLELLNDCRREAERLIDLLWEPGPGKTKPRTYRKRARRAFLAEIKKRRKGRKSLRKALRQQLNYLARNLRTLAGMLEKQPSLHKKWTFRDLRIYWVIQHIYRQQRQMYTQRTRSCPDRIVSIYQPRVRPIVTGKAARRVEFGAKCSASLVAGIVGLDRLGWDNFHEGLELTAQVEGYRSLRGYYPEAVIADQKYGTRENRRWLKKRGIRFSGKALGRPKQRPTAEDQALNQIKKEENRLRSQIEGKFGQGKNAYNLGKIRARLTATSQSWIAAIFLVMNLDKLPDLPLIFVLIWEYILRIGPATAPLARRLRMVKNKIARDRENGGYLPGRVLQPIWTS